MIGHVETFCFLVAGSADIFLDFVRFSDHGGTPDVTEISATEKLY